MKEEKRSVRSSGCGLGTTLCCPEPILLHPLGLRQRLGIRGYGLKSRDESCCCLLVYYFKGWRGRQGRRGWLAVDTLYIQASTKYDQRLAIFFVKSPGEKLTNQFTHQDVTKCPGWVAFWKLQIPVSDLTRPLKVDVEKAVMRPNRMHTC